MIRDSAVFSLNEIVLKPEGWPIFEATAEEADLGKQPPEQPGVYILALRSHYLSYPGGSSRVLYIGRAMDAEQGLRRRLREHYTFTNQRRIDTSDTGRQYARYEWSAVHGIQATWSVAPRPVWSDVARIEHRLLYWFAELYGAAPLGNAQAAWSDKHQAPEISRTEEPNDAASATAPE